MRKGEGCDVGTCSRVKEDGALVALRYCWASVDNSYM